MIISLTKASIHVSCKCANEESLERCLVVFYLFNLFRFNCRYFVPSRSLVRPDLSNYVAMSLAMKQ